MMRREQYTYSLDATTSMCHTKRYDLFIDVTQNIQYARELYVTLTDGRERRVIDLFFFFFQAEDGIRDLTVTGVQTCALPISAFAGRARCADRAFAAKRTLGWPRGSGFLRWPVCRSEAGPQWTAPAALHPYEIGRASCRERV